MLFSALTTLAYVGFASAQAYTYTPLVQIPGVPAGAVNLSLYLVGLYDFLLSVVGIVAVMMLIIGGMRYITAAGNQAAISDAKDIITNALFGLLLAILSWVIVAEINPDVLYLKKPGGEFVNTSSTDIGVCYTNYDAALPPGTECTCKDTPPTILGASSAEDCHLKCKNASGVFDPTIAIPAHNCTCEDQITTLVAADADNCNSLCREATHCDLLDRASCVENGRDAGVISEGNCYCADLTQVKPATGVDCQTTCKTTGHCGWDYLVVRVNADGETTETDITGNSYHKLDPAQSKLWDFFLTNEGEWGAFEVSANSYTTGGNTYECAIFVTARRTFGGLMGDYRNIFWVLPGTILHSDGFSLERDLCKKYAQCCDQAIFGPNPSCEVESVATPGCDWSYASACALSTSTSNSNDLLMHKGAGKLFKTAYTSNDKNIGSMCDERNYTTVKERSCSFANSITKYRPKQNLICNPTTGSWTIY